MKLISSLKKSERIRKLLIISISIFLFGYILCTPLFGQSSSYLRYLIYLLASFLGVSTFLYVFLFGSFKTKPILLVIPCFTLFALIGTVLHSRDFRAWFSLVLLAISFFVLFYAFKSLESRFVVLNIALSSLFAFSIIFIIYYRKELINFESFGDKDFRLGSDFDNPNNISIFALIAYSISLYLFLFFTKKIRFIYLIPLLSNLLMGVSTGSRMFFIGFILFTLIICFFKFKKHKILFILFVVFLVLFIVLFINLPFMDTMRSRIIRSINTILGIGIRVDTSTIERTIWADYGVYLGSKHLFFGLGSKGFSVFSGTGTYSHNNYSEVFCDFGLFGFVLFYIPLCYCAFKSFTTKHECISLVVPYILYYIVAGFFNVFYYNKIYYLILALMFYLLFCPNKLLFKPRRISKVDKLVIVCDSDNKKELEFAEQLNLMKVKCFLIVYEKTTSKFIFGSDVCEKNIVCKKRNGLVDLRRFIKKIKPSAVINTSEMLFYKISFALLHTKVPYFNLVKSGKRISFVNKMCVNHAQDVILDKEAVKIEQPKWLTRNHLTISDWHIVHDAVYENKLVKHLLESELEGSDF